MCSVRYLPIKPGYRAGDDGSVWSCIKQISRGHYGYLIILTDEWHQLKPGINTKGYMCVCIGNRYRTVHSLILECFVGPCPYGMQCRHLDGNPLNNRLDNLCWGTPKENMNDMVRHGKSGVCKGERHGAAKLKEVDIPVIFMLREAGFTQVQIAEIFCVSKRTIRKIVNRETWAHVIVEPNAAWLL